MTPQDTPDSLYKYLANSLKDIILLHDLQGKILYVNPSLEHLTGWKPGELMGGSGPKHLHPVDQPRVAQTINKGFASQQDYNFETRYRCKDGSYVWLDVNTHLIHNDEGAPTHWISTCYDITDRKQAEERVAYRLGIEEIVTRISTHFIEVPFEDINNEVQQAMTELAEFIGATGIYFDLFASDRQTIAYAYEWLAGKEDHDVKRFIGFDFNNFPHSYNLLLQNKPLRLPPFDQIPEEEAERWRKWKAPPSLAIPLINDGELIGVVGLNAAQHITSWLEEDLNLLKLMGDVFTNVLVRRQAEETLRRREAILAAVNTSAELLLGERNWESHIHTVLAELGKATLTSRVCLFRNQKLRDGSLSTSLIYEWTRPEEKSQLDNPMLKHLPLRFIPSPYAEEIKSGDAHQLNIFQQLSQELQTVMQKEGDLHLQLIPVTVGRRWWGFISFDDSIPHRQWSQPELDALNTAGETLGAAIHRKHAEEAYQTLVDQTHQELYILQGDQIVFSNPAGCQFYRLPNKRREPFPLDRLVDSFHPEDQPYFQKFIHQCQGGKKTNRHLELRRIMEEDCHSWVEVLCTFTHFHGSPAVQIAMLDITERKQIAENIQRLNRFYDSILESVKEGVWVVDKQDMIFYANHAMGEMFNMRMEDMIGKSILKIFADDRKNIFIPYFHKAKERLKPYSFRAIPTTDAEGKPAHQSGWVLPMIKNGKYNGMICTASDVSDHKRAEDALSFANRQLKESITGLEKQNHQITLLNEMGDVLQSCLEYREVYDTIQKFGPEIFPDFSGALYIFSGEAAPVVGESHWGDIPENELEFSYQMCWALRRNRIHIVNSDEDITCKHVTQKEIVYFCIPLIAQGEALGTIHLRCSRNRGSHTPLEDILPLATMVSERVGLTLANLNLYKKMQQQSIQDPLTGMFNRRYLEETMKREINRAIRQHQTIGVVMIDIDDFKNLNDTHGHTAGDKVLKAFGEYLQNNIRGGDVACRYGGDEFVLVLPGATKKDTHNRLKMLEEGLKTLTVTHGEIELGPIQISKGIASFPRSGNTMERLLVAADDALYKTKNHTDTTG